MAFFIGKHKAQAGWKVQPSGYACTVVGKVKNISDTTSTSFIHFKFLDAKGEVLGNVSCNSGDVEPGRFRR